MDSFNQKRFAQFLELARFLNGIGITPALTGSLGVDFRVKLSKDADDIDVILPDAVEASWPVLKAQIVENGWTADPDHTHELGKDGTWFGFGFSSDFWKVGKVSDTDIPIEECQGVTFKVPTLGQFLSIYRHSRFIPSRREKKGAHDAAMLEFIKAAVKT